MPQNPKKWLAVAVFGLAIGACSSLSPGGFGSSKSVNYAAGSPVGAGLSGADQGALYDVFLRAMETGGDGARNPWSGPRARGVIIPGGFLLANLKSDPDIRMPARRGLDLMHTLETELGLYVLTRNSNVRSGPSTERTIVEVVPSGTGVEVAGQIVGQPWMLIAVDARIRGYVHENLLIKAPGTELELVGGPRRKPQLCRAFTQRISAYGQTDEWTGAACDFGNGWRLAPPEPVAAEDDELLGL